MTNGAPMLRRSLMDFDLTASHRYQNDATFKQLVDMLEYQLHCAAYTPSELREAVLLAAINFETRRTHHFEIRDGKLIDEIADLRQRIDDLTRDQREKWRAGSILAHDSKR
jgi:hypothetical protein